MQWLKIRRDCPRWLHFLSKKLSLISSSTLLNKILTSSKYVKLFEINQNYSLFGSIQKKKLYLEKAWRGIEWNFTTSETCMLKLWSLCPMAGHNNIEYRLAIWYCKNFSVRSSHLCGGREGMENLVFPNVKSFTLMVGRQRDKNGKWKTSYLRWPALSPSKYKSELFMKNYRLWQRYLVPQSWGTCTSFLDFAAKPFNWTKEFHPQYNFFNRFVIKCEGTHHHSQICDSDVLLGHGGTSPPPRNIYFSPQFFQEFPSGLSVPVVESWTIHCGKRAVLTMGACKWPAKRKERS